MLINQSFEIDSCDDVELNIKRTSKLEYRISYDDEKEMKAIVFIIGGYGANAKIIYHCFCQRRSDVEKYSAFTIFTKDDVSNLSQVLLEIGVNINVNLENAQQCYELLNQNITTLKSQGKLAQNYQAKFTSTFVPPNGDYQNYGIMAAIDHIV